MAAAPLQGKNVKTAPIQQTIIREPLAGQAAPAAGYALRRHRRPSNDPNPKPPPVNNKSFKDEGSRALIKLSLDFVS